MTVAGKKCNLPIFLKMFCGGYSGDGGKGRDALLKYPSYVSYDRDEEVLYIMDSGNKVVRALTKSGYITTIGGGGDEVDESKSAVMNKINQAGPLLFTRFKDVVSDENGYSIEIQRRGVYLGDGRMIRKIYHPIKTLLLTEEGTRVVKEGIIDWDDNEKIYKGNKLKLLVEYEKQRGMEDVDIKWDQVICRQSLKEKQVGGVFRSDLGCNKFGGDYISSYEYKIGNCSSWEKGLGGCLYEGDPIDDGNYRRIYIYGIRRDHPGKNRLFVRANIYGSDFFFRTVDIPYKLSENGLEISPGIQLGVTEDIMNFKNVWDGWWLGKEFYENYPNPYYLCDKDVRENTVVDACYFGTYGFFRSPHKMIPIVLGRKYNDCFYYLYKNGESIQKVCVPYNCENFGLNCHYDTDKSKIISTTVPLDEETKNELSDASFYSYDFTKGILSAYVDKLLDRMEKRGMNTIQITYDASLSRICKSVKEEYGEYVCEDSNASYGETAYPIIAPQVPIETKDMIIDLILEKNKTRRIIKNIFLKPSLWAELRTYHYNNDGQKKIICKEDVTEDSNYDCCNPYKTTIVKTIEKLNLGPLSKDMYYRVNPVKPTYIEDMRFIVWDLHIENKYIVTNEGKNLNPVFNVRVNWEDILKEDINSPITLSTDESGRSILSNLNEAFYTGNIKTCGPMVNIKVEGFDDNHWYAVEPLEKIDDKGQKTYCEDIKINGLDCDEQDRKGIYNYYCFLRHAVKKGNSIIKYSGQPIDVYISISNDHVAPAIALSKVHVNGVDILTDLKNNCNGCKFTNAMVVEQLNFNEDNFWMNGNGNPYLYENDNDKIKTFDTLVKSYITHPIFGDTGFGVNAYAPGNCVNSGEEKIDRCNRFCYLYSGDENNTTYSYIKSINCGANFECKQFKDDINNGVSRIFTNPDPTQEDSPGILIFNYPKDNETHKHKCIWYKEVYDEYGNLIRIDIDYCENRYYIDIGQRVCVNSQSCKGNFYEIDPPLNNDNCASIFRCKINYYDKYLSYIRDYYHGNIDKPLFISEIGAQSSEYSAYSQRLTFEWNNDLRRNISMYAITNIRDYQEQVDMVEGDVMVFLGNDALRGSKKLKGVIIFSDDLLYEKSDLFYYNFPPTGKPLDKFIPLLTGKGVR